MSDIDAIIARKNQGLALSSAQIRQLVTACSNLTASDPQVAKFTQAVFSHGMSVAEIASLTQAMCASGEKLTWQLDGPIVDKHSTGGVGDFISIVLAPTLAACGVFVPMISGRGLGHTGGTIDKLESIPGYNSSPSVQDFQNCVKEVGTAIIAQSLQIAPADKRIYAIRDATGTVSSVPLIVSSILSKKLAEGLDTLVIDLKSGNGAFANDKAFVLSLEKSIIEVANKLGLNVQCVTSKMDAPISYNVGNSLEIIEVIEFLTGKKRHPQALLLLENLGSALLTTTGKATDTAAAINMLHHALDSGQASERFKHMVSYLGGPADLIDGMDKYLPQAPIVKPVLAKQTGKLTGYNMKAVGEMCRGLSASKSHPGAIIEHRTGLSDLLPIGTWVNPDTVLCCLHASSQSDWESAADVLRAYCVDIHPVENPQSCQQLVRPKVETLK